MISLFFTMASVYAAECTSVESIPSAVQVAWVSPVGDKARDKEMIEVVELHSLQQWIGEEEADAKQVLHQLGMLPKRSRRTIDPAEYKIVIFDVESSTLCRPIDVSTESNETPPQSIAGLNVCTERSKPATLYSRFGYTGCGYTWNTQSQSKGLDVYRIAWAEASTWGFCVLPLSRFLLGAPK